MGEARRRRVLIVSLIGILSILVLKLSAQQAGSNINVLPAYPIGNAYPPKPITTTDQATLKAYALRGDNYLQRQVEPVVAASSYNPDHLLAAFGDYRTIDYATDMVVPGNAAYAWLGYSRSYDRGKHWYGALVPGFPGGTSAADLNSPLYGLASGSDPTVATTPGGHFYLGGLFFTPGGISNIVVMHLRDVPSLEGGDSIQPGKITIVDKGSQSDTGNFEDKPAIAGDIPRGTTDPKTCGPVYMAYTIFNGGGGSTPFISKIGFTRSAQGKCGESWSNNQYLHKNYKQNQGTAIAVDPISGKIYIVWRHIYVPGGDGYGDSILMVSSSDGGSTFTSPVPITGSDFAPYDQVTITTTADPSHVAFRSNAFPAIVVDAAGNVYVAVQERSTNIGGAPVGYYEPRITIRTLRKGAASWTAKSAIDSVPLAGWQQMMPSLSFSAGLLNAMWYDFRRPEWVSSTDTAWGRPSDCNPANGRCYITGLDRRMETRIAQSPLSSTDANGNPIFSGGSVPVTRYNPLQTIGGLPAVNRANLPMFVGGTVAFTGDYITLVSAAPFVATPGAANPFRWATRPEDTAAMTSLAVWTDSRDVVFPLGPGGAPDLSVSNVLAWQSYAPPGTGAVSCINPGSRNENIYFSEVKTGVVAGSPATSRQLVDGNGTPIERALPFYVQNTTRQRRFFRLTFQADSLTTPAAGSFVQATAGTAKQVLSVDATILPLSTTSKTIYVYCAACSAANAFAPFSINIRELDAIGGSPVVNGLATVLRFNNDPTSPFATNPHLAYSEFHDLSVTQWDNTQWDNTQWDNTQWDNTQWDNTQWDNTQWDNTQWDNMSPVGDLVTGATNVGNNASAYSVAVNINPDVAQNLAQKGYLAGLIITRSYNKASSNAACATQGIPSEHIISIVPVDLFDSQAKLIDSAAFATSPVANGTLATGSSSGAAEIQPDQVFVVLRLFAPKVGGVPPPPLGGSDLAAIGGASTAWIIPQAGNTVGSGTTATTTALATVCPAGGCTYGQPVSLAAHVVPQQGAIGGGTVWFREIGAGGATLRVVGNAPVDASGNAVLAVSGLTVGSHTFTATFIGTTTLTWSASGPVTQVIGKGAAAVTLGTLTQTYTGAPLTPTATTVPAGLTVTWSGAPQTNAGSYSVSASISDPNYTGSAGGTFVIDPAAATVTLGALTQTYTGAPLTPTATTVPAGLPVIWTGTPRTNAGSYSVSAAISDPNYTGSASRTFVISKAVAAVTLSNLAQTYDGTPKYAAVVTTPPVAVSVAYAQSGSAVAAPINAGSYNVFATVTDPNYAGSASGTLTIAKATATLLLSELVQQYDGTPKAIVVATSPAGLGGVTVTYTGANVVYGPSTGAPSAGGAYTVVARLANDNYAAAEVTDTLTIFVPAPTVQPFGFIGLLSPYKPPSQASFKGGSSRPIAWQYTKSPTDLTLADSPAANPTIRIVGPYVCDGAESGLTQLISPGNSDMQYSPTTMTWQVNWQTPTVLSQQCFDVYVQSGETGQQNGPFPIALIP